MEEQKQLIAHKNLRFNQLKHIQSLIKGTKIGTFRSNRNNKYSIGCTAAILYEEIKRDHIHVHKVADIIIKNVIDIQILSEIDTLQVYNTTIISQIHDNNILDILAQIDGFDSWQSLKQYLGNNFSGSWLLFDMDSIAITDTWKNRK